ncbi:MAG: pyridoxal-dependent decarboxylase [Thermaerobacter sp.]|nr:pyridoxal-dependent decarboxylase [Thermaerobacter sp.]
MRYPLEPDRSEMQALADAVLRRAIDFVEQLPERPASPAGVQPEEIRALQRRLLAPPAEEPTPLGDVLARMEEAADTAVESAGPSYLAYTPGGGLFAAAVADLYARATNRYIGLSAVAPGMAALEYSVVRWLCDVAGFPAGAGGILVSGGSTANFTALVAAREQRLGEDIAAGALYMTREAHHSVGKAARLAGLPQRSLRIVPASSERRMDVQAAARMIAADRAAGLRPFLLVGSAGTTNTGAIDPLSELADLAAREGLWYHVDGAYGGLFCLTERGRERLRGIERADSVTLDPHKGLFMPYGTGALIVRELRTLRAAHAASGEYLQDLPDQEVPDFADLGPELTREVRGLRVWLPLHLYGVAAFRAALDEKIDLAQHAYRRLAAEPLLDLPWEPQLSIVALRVKAQDGERADALGRNVLERVNAGRRVFLSSTVVEGRFTLRLAILAHRSHRDRVDEAVAAIIEAVRDASNSTAT